MQHEVCNYRSEIFASCITFTFPLSAHFRWSIRLRHHFALRGRLRKQRRWCKKHRRYVERIVRLICVANRFRVSKNNLLCQATWRSVKETTCILTLHHGHPKGVRSKTRRNNNQVASAMLHYCGRDRPILDITQRCSVATKINISFALMCTHQHQRKSQSAKIKIINANVSRSTCCFVGIFFSFLIKATIFPMENSRQKSSLHPAESWSVATLYPCKLGALCSRERILKRVGVRKPESWRIPPTFSSRRYKPQSCTTSLSRRVEGFSTQRVDALSC